MVDLGIARPLLLVAALALGCVGSGELPARLSGQIVGSDGKPLGPGLVLAERGKLHEGKYEVGGAIDAQGRFAIPLPGGGEWGVHLFHSDYTYLPVAVTVDSHQQIVLTNTMIAWGVWMDLTGLPVWPDQPDDARLVRMPADESKADNPKLTDVELTYPSADLLAISLHVSDPEADMSRMVLAYDEATGAGYALNPPGLPDANGDFPNGTYKLQVFLDARHVKGKSRWQFILSDNACNNSDVVVKTLPPASP